MIILSIKKIFNHDDRHLAKKVEIRFLIGDIIQLVLCNIVQKRIAQWLADSFTMLKVYERCTIRSPNRILRTLMCMLVISLLD